MTQESVNRATYESGRVVSIYSEGPFQIAEIEILIKYRDEYLGKRILDVGCGAGRTTELLRYLTDDYTGLDYSANMVKRCRERFPGVRCILGDARDMKDFADESFDFVVFSNNGIDSLVHEDRLKALREIHRVLVNGGLFIFSTHNRNYENALTRPKLGFSPNPLKQAIEMYRYARRMKNHRRNRKYERFEDDYWIINDRAHAYKLLTYYVPQDVQMRQLRDVGFETLEMYGLDGRSLPFDEVDRKSSWIYYVARKAGCSGR